MGRSWVLTQNSCWFAALDPRHLDVTCTCGDTGQILLMHLLARELRHVLGMKAYTFSKNHDILYMDAPQNIVECCHWLMRVSSGGVCRCDRDKTVVKTHFNITIPLINQPLLHQCPVYMCLMGAILNSYIPLVKAVCEKSFNNWCTLKQKLLLRHWRPPWYLRECMHSIDFWMHVLAFRVVHKTKRNAKINK